MKFVVVFLSVLGILAPSQAHQAERDSSAKGSPTSQKHPRDTAVPRRTPTSVENAYNGIKKDVSDYDCPEYPCLIFEDNFDSLDLNTWEPEKTLGGGGNWEFQYYDNNRSTVYVRDGELYIRPIPTSDKYGEPFLSSGTLSLWGHQPHNQCTGNAWYGCERVGNPTNFINPVQSGRLRSVQSFNLRYGRVEVEARMPKGDWMWPAIWMLSKNNAYGEWPASGEIDLVESRGNLDLQDEEGNQRGHTYAGATLHWGPYLPHNGWEKTEDYRTGTWADAFHRYILEWDDSSLRIFFDDDLVLETVPPAGGFWEMGNADWGLPDEQNPWQGSSSTVAPFDREFYLIMNVAVGGTNGFFPDTWTNIAYPKPWLNPSETGPRDFWEANGDWLPTWNGEEAAMVVNYVRAYKLEPDP
jgi:beta-glucanase (GH16 family)